MSEPVPESDAAESAPAAASESAASGGEVVDTDVLIIGAGPIGLFQVFELGLQGISAHVVDALPEAGGQCVELYADKPIYDIPGIVELTGRELIERLLEQIRPFGPVFHFNETIKVLEKRGEHDFRLVGAKGVEYRARAVVIAAGAGSFTPVKVRLEGIDRHEGSRLLYRVSNPEALAGQRLVVLGGGDAALDWALRLAPEAASLTLLNRSDRFRAAPASMAKLRELEESGRVRILLGTTTGFGESEGELDSLTVRHREGDTEERLELDRLLVFFGMSPKLGPLENWGIALDRNLVAVDVATFETSLAGVYAVGDIITYPGKKKLILSGFHETALAAFAIKEAFEPDRKIHLQYTTTSPLMHRRLGITD
ncbi:MAG: ferredoxin--NADP(+) reductase [Gammaproteobacteria bacterium]|nr:MAG: ferredoxin--NADP(+) reductase [Gammaproteobacteria bacterium]